MYAFSPQKLERLFPLKEVNPSPDDRSIINDIIKARGRMTMAITFSRQNNVGLRAHYLVLGKSRTRSRLRI